MDFASLANLGTGGIALILLWWMYQAAAEERKRNDERLDARDTQFRTLEETVRGQISASLAASTSTLKDSMSALRENSKVLERVLEVVASPKRRLSIKRRK